MLVRRLLYRLGYRILHAVWLVTRFPRRGVKCVVLDGERVLLVRHTYGRRCWDLPGGTLRRDEPPLSAARREMGEELGLEGADWVALGELRGLDGHRRDTVHCFRARLRTPALSVDRGEIAEADWFERARLPVDIGPYVRAILALDRATPTRSCRGAWT